MTIDQIRPLVRTGIDALFARDPDLFRINASERAIAHHFGCHLQLVFTEWDVDCEYNRDGHDDPKLVKDLSKEVRRRTRRRLEFNENVKREGEAESESDSVFPDVIVHHRTRRLHANNLLVVEIKKTTSNDGWDLDLEKLRVFTTDFKRPNMNYHYQVGLFVEFKTWKRWPPRGELIAEGIWFQEGKKIGRAETLATREFG